MKTPRTPPSAAPLPPTRDGVSPSSVVLPTGAWETIADFLVDRFPAVGRDVWQSRLTAGDVIDARGVPIDSQRRYERGLRVYYYRALAAEPHIPFEEAVLFQNEHLVVADKPHFLPVIPSGRYVQETLLVRLKRKLGIETLSPIHRIDRETAGLVVFTVQPSTRSAYQDLFLQKAIEKRYEAIAPFRRELAFPLIHRSRLVDDPTNFMKMREEAGEPNSETRLDLLEVRGEWARYGIEPVTGRKHQIRAHCAALGLPIRGDQIYPDHLPENTDDFAKPLRLLAKSISFTDPLSGAQRRFTSTRSLSFD